MKRLYVIMMAVLVLTGCAAARESGFYDHSSMYQDWDHFKFSAWGYKNAAPKDAQESTTQGWWGENVEIPGR